MRQGDDDTTQCDSTDLSQISGPDLVVLIDENTLNEYLNTKSHPVPEYNGESGTFVPLLSDNEPQVDISPETADPSEKPTDVSHKVDEPVSDNASDIETASLDVELLAKTPTSCAKERSRTAQPVSEIRIFSLSSQDSHSRLGDAINKRLNNTNDGHHEEIGDRKELNTNSTSSSSYRDLEKGDQVSGCTIHYENEIVAGHLSSNTTGKIRQTNSLSNFEKSSDKCTAELNKNRVSSPCKRQRSATCLIENESTRRKLWKKKKINKKKKLLNIYSSHRNGSRKRQASSNW